MGGGEAMKVKPVKVYFSSPDGKGDELEFFIQDVPTLEEAKSAFCDLKHVQKMLSPSEMMLPAELKVIYLNSMSFIFENPASESVVPSLASYPDIFEAVTSKKEFRDFVRSRDDNGGAAKGPGKPEGGENWFMRVWRWIKNFFSKFASFVSETSNHLGSACCDLLFAASKEKVAMTTLSVIMTILVAVLKRF